MKILLYITYIIILIIIVYIIEVNYQNLLEKLNDLSYCSETMAPIGNFFILSNDLQEIITSNNNNNYSSSDLTIINGYK